MLSSNDRVQRIRAVWVASALCFVDNLFQTCIIAFVPLHTTRLYYATHDIDHEDTMYSVGFIFAAHSLCYVVGSLLCRRIGLETSRRFHLMSGLALLLTAAVICMVSNASISWMVISRCIQGFASALIQTAATGLIADMYAGAMDGGTDFEHAFSNVVTANMFGAALGPVVGGILYTLQGFDFTYLAFALCFGVMGIGTSLLLDAPDPPIPHVQYTQHLSDRWVCSTVAGLSVAGWAMSMLEPTLPIHLDAAFGAREAVIGLAFTELILSQQVLMPIIFKLIDGKPADRPTYTLCAYVMLATFLLLMFVAKHLWLCFVMLFFFGFAAALAVAACNAELSEALAGEEIRSTHNLSNYFLKEIGYRIGTCLGPLVGAAFVGNSLAPFFITALGCIAFLPLFFLAKESSSLLQLRYS